MPKEINDVSPLTYMERKILSAIANRSMDFEGVPPRSRGGVVASLKRKKLVDGEYNPKITQRGKIALKQKPPRKQRDKFIADHGRAKAHGIEPRFLPASRRDNGILNTRNGFSASGLKSQVAPLRL